MIKLSELKDDEILVVGAGNIMTKEEYLEEKEGYFGMEVYTTKEYKMSICARDMLELAIEEECRNMYECWDDVIWSDIGDVDIKELQTILDKILSRNNVAYIEDNEVEVDI